MSSAASDHVLSWTAARTVAGELPRLGEIEVSLSAAAGLVLAADVVARTDLPPFTASAMDGWAVSGLPPWTIAPQDTPLLSGTAAAIVTGGPAPEGTDAVLRIEDGEIQPDPGVLRPRLVTPSAGADLRRRGSECRAGEVVAERGTRAVPAVLGLVAAAGADTVRVVLRPLVDLLVLGDELLATGPARDGLVRDSLSPMLPPWLAALGAEAPPARRVIDTVDALRDAIVASTGDLIVTTGSTAAGPRDHLHAVLKALGAELLVDGVDVRPGHPMLMARLADGRPLVGLPGNPLAAVSGLLTLVEPALRALAGLGPAAARTTTLVAAIKGHPRDVRLVPVSGGTPVHHVGPAMLRGLAAADAVAVVPAGGAAAGDVVEILRLP